MSVDHIRYDLLAQQALRGVVRTVLIDAARKGLQGEHHFFISFNTRADGVRVSSRLREQYPDEMTIVLQHQFWDLKVHDESFEVGLSFGGVAERLTVPFAAIKSFVDPSVQFALQFEEVVEPAAEAVPVKAKTEKETAKPRKSAKQDTKPESKPDNKSEPRRSVPSVPRVPPAIPALPPASDSQPAVLADTKSATTAPNDDKPDKPKRGGEVVRLDRFRKK